MNWRLETSPSTHTSRNSVSSTPWMRSVSSLTVRARVVSGGRPAADRPPPKSMPFCCMGRPAF